MQLTILKNNLKLMWLDDYLIVLHYFVKSCVELSFLYNYALNLIFL